MSSIDPTHPNSPVQSSNDSNTSSLTDLTSRITAFAAQKNISASDLDEFYQGATALNNLSSQSVSNYLRDFANKKSREGHPLTMTQQQTFLQYSMSILNQQGNKNSLLYTSLNQTLMGTVVANSMLNKYMSDIFSSPSGNPQRDEEDNGW